MLCPGGKTRGRTGSEAGEVYGRPGEGWDQEFGYIVFSWKYLRNISVEISGRLQDMSQKYRIGLWAKDIHLAVTSMYMLFEAMAIKECENIREERSQQEMVDVNQKYCGDHFTMYTNIESCCTPETNIILYVNYTSI